MTRNSAEDMNSAHQWLEDAAHSLGLSPMVTRALVGDLLDLTKQVAHDPSRPAAPITAFLVGLASGVDMPAGASDEEVTEHVRNKLAVINHLLKEYAN